MTGVYFEMKIIQTPWMLTMEKHTVLSWWLIFIVPDNFQLCTLYNTLMIRHCELL